MSGVSDLPFRRLAHRLGAGLVVSEMVASEELVRQRADVLRRAEGSELSPFVIQLVGREAHWMAEGARIAEGLGADIIDINMGCPAREVTGKLSGSRADARSRSRPVARSKPSCGAVRVPVTLKMRLGWDDKSRNAPSLATRAEAAGVQLITVHGRTRCQFFKGTRRLERRARRRGAPSRIPVIVNGDITSGEEARRGARGIRRRRRHGRPRRLWCALAAGRIAAVSRDRHAIPAPPSLAEQGAIACEHVEAMLAHYGAHLGLRNARKHIGWYLETSGRPADSVKAWRRQLCTQEDPARVLHDLAAFYDEALEVAA